MKTCCRDLDVYECNNCSLTFTWPLLSGEEEDTGNENSSITEKEFYDGLLKSHDIQSKIAIQKAPLMLSEYSKIMNRKPSSILELGCGTGQYSDAWNILNVRWLGVEVNKIMLEFCQEKQKNVVTFDNFSKSTELFDVIFLSQVLEHILEPDNFIKMLFSRLTNGGILHIDVPNHDGLISIIRKINPLNSDYGFIQPKHHLIAYNKKSLNILLKNVGFNIINLKPYVNNDPTYGQLNTKTSLKSKVLFFPPKMLGMGSLLVCVAQKSR